MSRREWTVGGGAGVVVLAVIAAAAAATTTPPEPAPTPAVSGGAEYDRDLFGGWADLDGDGCDTREEIIYRDVTGEPAPESECIEVVAGAFVEPYSGATVKLTPDNRGDYHIDHVVPLSWAWEHGANTWSDDVRVAFANDPANLLLVDGSLNMAKGDAGPSEWVPPNEEVWCDYAATWAEVTTAYDLTVPGPDEAWITTVCDQNGVRAHD